MAITAQFLADYSQFVSETKRADTALHGLGTSATKVATDSTSSFAGMGTAVRNLAGAFGVGLSIGAVVSFGKSVFDAASTIHDMGLKLGISSEAVQGFKFAAEQAGSTLDAVGTAINKMNVNLAEGDKGTVAALRAAGLEFAKIRAMKSEDAFLAITDAAAKIEDPMVRAQVVLALFGKTGAELLPAIVEGFRGVSDSASKMSNETIKSLEAAQDAWAKVGNTFTIVTGTMIAKAIEFWGTLREQNFGALGVAAKKAAVDIELLPPAIAKVTQEEEKAAAAAEKLEAAWKKANATAIAKIESDVRNAAGMILLNDAIATQERALKNLEGEWMLNRDAGMLAAEASAAVWDSIKDHSTATLQGLADKAQAAYERAKLHSGEFSAAAIEHFRTVAVAALETATGIKVVADELAGLTIVGQKATSIFNPAGSPEKPSGVTVFSGGISGNDLSAYGESVKQARLVPRGMGEGTFSNGTTVNNVFNIVDTEANIARRVSEHLTRSVLQGARVS